MNTKPHVQNVTNAKTGECARLVEKSLYLNIIETDKGEPCFVAKDVCQVLGIKNTADALCNLDDDEKGIDNTDTLGETQRLTVVTLSPKRRADPQWDKV